MNAERLHAVARELREDFAVTETAALIQQLSDHINVWASNPADANASQQVSDLRRQLNERLAASRTNEFSDSWKLTLEELGIWDLTGDRLREQIEEIFRANEVTPLTAASDVAELNTQIQRVSTSLDNLVAAFEAFHIGAEELEPGEFEVGFLIPRSAVNNELEPLGDEFEELDQILVPFSELIGEGRPDLKVRSISSSEFMVFLMASPGLALTMAKVIESLLSSYEKIRSIRTTAASLEADEVPKELTESLIAHANERMGTDIQNLTNELVGQAQQDVAAGGRGYELEVDVKRSLTRLANRIDEGYSIEVRAFSPAEDGGDEDVEGEPPERVVEIAREITERQPRMRSMNLTGRPILELPEGDDDEPAQENDAPEADNRSGA